MKLLVIFGIILGILSAYFIFDFEKSITIKGSEVTPVGTDIPKLILNKAKDFLPASSNDQNVLSKNKNLEVSEIIDKIKNNVANIASQAANLVKHPIENKISEVFCPQK